MRLVKSSLSFADALVAMAVVTVCISDDLPAATRESIGDRTAIGLAIEVDNGVATPLQEKRGQTVYLNQIDLRASTTSTVDEGVSGLRTRGDFANLAWGGRD